VIRKRGTGLQAPVYAGRDPLSGGKRYVSQQVPGQTKASMRQAKQIEAWLLEEVSAGRHKGVTVADFGRAARAVAAGVATDGAARRAYHRLQLPGRLDRPRPPGPRQALCPPARRRHPGCLLCPAADPWRQERPGPCASTVHEVHAVLSGALKQAVVWGWVGHNPAKLATAPSVQKADVQPPQAEDATWLLSAARTEGPELGLFLRLAVVLGARRGEICGLRWPDIDFDRGEVLIAGNVVRVPRQALVHMDTKTHAKRRVAIGAGTVELLRARRVAQAKDALACGTTLVADAYVFSHVPEESAPVDPDGISHRFLRLARQLGVNCSPGPSGGPEPSCLAARRPGWSWRPRPSRGCWLGPAAGGSSPATWPGWPESSPSEKTNLRLRGRSRISA